MARAKAGKERLTSRQKQGNATRRKRAVRKWCNTTARRLTFLGLVSGALVTASGGWWFWHSGKLGQVIAHASATVWQETARMGFKVKDVYLEGRKFTPMEDVNAALGVQAGDPILALSLPEIRQRLEAIPRVKYAEVARVLPDQLHVHLQERVPAAMWQSSGKLHLIDPDGMVMEYVDVKKYPNLLVVVGEDAPGHTHELLETLAASPEIYKQVIAAVRVGERRWNLRFRNGLEVKLPEQNEAEAWQQFVQMEHDHHILSRPVEYVDMRLSDRVYIKSQPAAVPEVKTAEKKKAT